MAESSPPSGFWSRALRSVPGQFVSLLFGHPGMMGLLFGHPVTLELVCDQPLGCNGSILDPSLFCKPFQAFIRESDPTRNVTRLLLCRRCNRWIWPLRGIIEGHVSPTACAVVLLTILVVDEIFELDPTAPTVFVVDAVGSRCAPFGANVAVGHWVKTPGAAPQWLELGEKDLTIISFERHP